MKQLNVANLVEEKAPSPRRIDLRAGEGRGEGFTHFRKCFAFTLAEVLITLAVIGIVAAMTIPNLVQSYKKKVVETRLVNFYSAFDQALKLSELDNGDKSTWNPQTTAELWAYFEPYVKYNKLEGSSSSNNDLIYVYLSDGSVVGIAIYNFINNAGEVTNYSYGGHFLLFPFANTDNKKFNDSYYGTKCFTFGFWPNANTDQFKYHKGKGVIPYVANWDGDVDKLKTDAVLGCNEKGSRQFCTKLIELNGWKIPEDYPFKF